MICRIQTGIDTLSYHHGLSPKQKNTLLKNLRAMPGFITVKNLFWEDTYVYRSNYFHSQGIRLEIQRKKGSSWRLYVIIHPALLLGNADRSALYQAKKGRYTQMMKTADKFLKSVNIPCSIDDMKLSRIDVTRNYIFDEAALVDEYIRIMKKSCILHHYKLDWFREEEHKAKDCQAANRHSHKQMCKSAAFFAYDKTAQLQMTDRFPDSLIGKGVLRIEGQFRLKALKKWISSKESNWEIIKDVYKNSDRILKWYLDRVQSGGNIIRYKDAVSRINQAKMKSKTRERMLYLLRKTSDSDTLSAALKKLKKKFGLSQNQANTVLKKFKKLGISPITLRNDSEFDSLPALRDYSS